MPRFFFSNSSNAARIHHVWIIRFASDQLGTGPGSWCSSAQENSALGEEWVDMSRSLFEHISSSRLMGTSTVAWCIRALHAQLS